MAASAEPYGPVLRLSSTNTYSCCASRMTSARLPSRSATTKSKPPTVGIDRDEGDRAVVVLPRRDGAVPLAEVEDDRPALLLHVERAERRARVARGELAGLGRVRRDDEALALLRDRGLALRGADAHLLLGLGLAVEEQLDEAAQERPQEGRCRNRSSSG